MDSPCIKQTVCKVFKIFQCGKYLVAYVLKHSQSGEITMLVTDIGKSCPSRKVLTKQICILTLLMIMKFFAKISEFTV